METDKIYKVTNILKWLLQGEIIYYKGRYVTLSNDYRIGCLALNPETGEMIPPDENGNCTIVFILDDTLQNFIQWAESIDEDTYIILASNIALNKIHHKNIVI